MWGEHSRVFSYIQSYCCVWWSPPLLKSRAGHILAYKRWLNDASSVLRNVYCNWSGCITGNESHRGGIWCLWWTFLNASDLNLNVRPPECVILHRSPEVAEVSLDLSRCAVSGRRYWKRDVLYFTWTTLNLVSLFSNFWNVCFDSISTPDSIHIQLNVALHALRPS